MGADVDRVGNGTTLKIQFTLHLDRGMSGRPHTPGAGGGTKTEDSLVILEQLTGIDYGSTRAIDHPGQGLI